MQTSTIELDLIYATNREGRCLFSTTGRMGFSAVVNGVLCARSDGIFRPRLLMDVKNLLLSTLLQYWLPDTTCILY